MIEVDVLNCRSKKKSQIYRDALGYFLHQLMPNLKNVCVDLSIENNLDADAFCTQLEQRYFIIEIFNKLPFKEQIKSIGHETVHMRQFLRKELGYKNGKILWKGKPYVFKPLKRNDIIKEDYYDYYNCPWEIEAYELEEKLYNNFTNWYNKYF